MPPAALGATWQREFDLKDRNQRDRGETGTGNRCFPLFGFWVLVLGGNRKSKTPCFHFRFSLFRKLRDCQNRPETRNTWFPGFPVKVRTVGSTVRPSWIYIIDMRRKKVIRRLRFDKNKSCPF